jgi:cell division protein FtsW (lipid II flippase)
MAGELVVPAIMLLSLAAYWSVAMGLSLEAVAFPLALSAVLVAAIIAILIGAAVASRRGDDAAPADAEASGKRRGRSAKAWAIVLLPLPLVFFWQGLGAVPVFFFYVAAVLYVLGERRGLWLVVLPLGLAIGLVYLFKVVLYVRLPDMPWMLGG